MSYTSYEIRRGLQYILDNRPHDLLAIKNLYKDRHIPSCSEKISLESILCNIHWTVEEKVFLLRMYDYITEYEDINNPKFCLIDFVMPVDYALLYENFSGFCAYIIAGGHLSIDSISLIRNHITDPKQKEKIVDLLFSKYNKDKKIDVIDYKEKDVKTISLGYYLSYLVVDDLKLTDSTVSLVSEDVNLLNELFYYSVVFDNKILRDRLLSIDSVDGLKKMYVQTLLNLYPQLIDKAVDEKDVNQLKALIRFYNRSLNKLCLSKKKESCVRTKEKTDELKTGGSLSKCQKKVTSVEISQSIVKCYDSLIYLSVDNGNIEQAQFYYNDAVASGVGLGFVMETTLNDVNKPKCIIKHLSES